MLSEKTQNMIETLIDAIKDKKGYDLISLDVTEATAICDAFIIASGLNKSQIDAIVDKVEETMLDQDFQMRNREGRSESGWVLLDYEDVVVHIFSHEMREFYSLDHTWRDVPVIYY